MALTRLMLERYSRVLFQRLAIAISPLLRLLERALFPSLVSPACPPVFIVGAPRTGSTILYQALTNAYEISYIDNLACTWHQNLRFGLWLSESIYGSNAHNSFKAEYGQTNKSGGHAPSECGEFWYRWLPKSRHFVEHDEVSEADVAEIRQEVLQASATSGKPLLFKNLNAGQRLRLIHRLFPDAKIIFVRRDPRFVIRSIRNARQELSVPLGRWWSVMPKNVDELLRLSEGERSAAQVYYLERQIEEDRSLFCRENFVEVHYQDFDECLIHRLGCWLGARQRAGASIPDFLKDDISNLDGEERAELEVLAGKYPFKRELYV